MTKNGDSQSRVLWPAAVAAAASGQLWKIQILASHPRLTESEGLGVLPSNLGLISSPSHSDVQLKSVGHRVNGQKLNLEKNICSKDNIQRINTSNIEIFFCKLMGKEQINKQKNGPSIQRAIREYQIKIYKH